MYYMSIKIEEKVYDKLSRAGSLGSTYSEVMDAALSVYLKEGAKN